MNRLRFFKSTFMVLMMREISCMRLKDLDTYKIFRVNNSDSHLDDLITSKESSTNERTVVDTLTANDNNGGDITSLLSQMPDGELFKLLANNPERTEYKLFDDVFASTLNDVPQEANKFESNNKANNRFEKVNDDNLTKKKGYFRVPNKPVEFTSFFSKHAPPPEVPKGIVDFNNPEFDLDNDYSEESNREMVFDMLVAKLKKLCFSKSNQKRRKTKKIVFNLDLDADVPTEILKIAKKNLKLRSYKPDKSERDRDDSINEHIFLILNEEIISNETNDLIYVDPDSLNQNSTVLILGPLTSPFGDQQLKIVMSRITSELSKPDYLSLLSQLANGKLVNNNAGILKNMITGSHTRRYVKPQRCNHQSKLAKVHGGPQWLVCSGYLRINGPSLYD